MAADDPNLEAYRQANDDLRHYTSLRYTVLGVFVAISGGLFAFSVEKLEGTSLLGAIALFNAVTAVALGIFELRYSAIADFYADKVDKLAAELGMSKLACSAPLQTMLGKWLGPLLTIPIYVGSLVMWVYAWFMCGSGGTGCVS